MKWPRGTYNGRRIVGIDLRVVLDVRHWRLMAPDADGRCLAFGPLRIWLAAAYDPLE